MICYRYIDDIFILTINRDEIKKIKETLEEKFPAYFEFNLITKNPFILVLLEANFCNSITSSSSSICGVTSGHRRSLISTTIYLVWLFFQGTTFVLISIDKNLWNEWLSVFPYHSCPVSVMFSKHSFLNMCLNNFSCIFLGFDLLVLIIIFFFSFSIFPF